MGSIPSQTGRPGCRCRRGVTLIEVVITSTLSLTLTLAVGVLLVGGNRAWVRTFNLADSKARQDALALTVAFGSVGRKANRLGYTIYHLDGDRLIPARPKTNNPEEIVSGDAVEFIYWDVPLDKTDSHDVMSVTKTGTAYALFYLDGSMLKVDYGPYPPGAVSDRTKGGRRNTTGVRTHILAENVSVDPDAEVKAFSHTTINGVGQGSVRINVIITDPQTKQRIKVATATLMRNIWPR